MNPWRFDKDDGSFGSWGTSGWHTLCNAGLFPSMALADLGSAPFELEKTLPKAFSGYIMQLATDEADPEDKTNPSASRPQRGSPLPYAIVALEDLPELCKDSAGFNCRWAAREVLTKFDGQPSQS